MMSDYGGEEDLTAQPTFELPLPGPDGYTADDLDRIPDLPPHTELIDGGLHFVSPQKNFHTTALDLLVNGMRRSCPPDLRVRREMTIKINVRNRPQPDIVVLPAAAANDMQRTHFDADQIVLAVEVESPDSLGRDRERKPQLYATAGIQYFWRVADNDDKMVVYAYELDQVGKRYELTGIFHNRLRVTVPFEIDIDLTEAEEL